MKSVYLLIDGSTLVAPLLFSFHPRIGFYHVWRTYLPAMFITAAIFLLWDAAFTSLGVWGFNPNYLTGLYIGNLPVEECLFFVCIPYACVFTVFCLRLAGGVGPGAGAERIVTAALVGIFLTLAWWNHSRRYTAATFLTLGLLLVYCSFVLKTRWLGDFYISWLFLLVPLLLVDGVLTGTGLNAPIVWYNTRDIVGIRVLTIPVEDFFYGMELVLVNMLVFDLLQHTAFRHDRKN